MDSYIKFISSDSFQRKLKEKKGLSRQQLLAYRDFQNNFKERVSDVEQQFQMPISKRLSKREIVNLYSAHIMDNFTIKEFVEKTNMNKNTARRELIQSEKRGVTERVSKGVYRYK